MATNHIRPGEEKYAEAIRRLLTDDALQGKLEADPVGTLEGLGLELDDDARKALARGDAADLAVGPSAVVAPLVRVITGGTRPVVSVVTASSTFVAAREARGASPAPAAPKGSRRPAPKTPR
jgi:hypothetical protein